MQSSLNIEPIKIKIADIYKYSQVAYLVDRDDFLKDIVKTRKLLKLKDLIPRKDFELIEEVQTDYVNNLFELKISIDKSPEYKRRANIFKKKLEIENFLSLIFKKYKIADDLSNIVVYSILCNEVWDKDLNIGASFFPGDEIQLAQGRLVDFKLGLVADPSGLEILDQGGLFPRIQHQAVQPQRLFPQV